MDNYILELAKKADGVAQAVTPRESGAIAILMTDGRKIEFTAGEVFSAQMKERARVFTEQREAHANNQAQKRRQEAIDAYNSQIERVTAEKARKGKIAPAENLTTKPTHADSAKV
jgi:hypothetical protein